jgi:hypothetical protein
MDSSSRKSIRNVGLVLIAWGLLQALVISAFSRDPAILSFGFGPAFIGLFMFITSFFKLEQRNVIPMWRNAAFYVLTLAIWLPSLFFNYHFPPKARLYVLLAYTTVGALLLLWPAKHQRERQDRQPIGGGGVI